MGEDENRGNQGKEVGASSVAAKVEPCGNCDPTGHPLDEVVTPRNRAEDQRCHARKPKDNSRCLEGAQRSARTRKFDCGCEEEGEDQPPSNARSEENRWMVEGVS